MIQHKQIARRMTGSKRKIAERQTFENSSKVWVLRVQTRRVNSEGWSFYGSVEIDHRNLRDVPSWIHGSTRRGFYKGQKTTLTICNGARRNFYQQKPKIKAHIQRKEKMLLVSLRRFNEVNLKLNV